jgi:hypothetical protein
MRRPIVNPPGNPDEIYSWLRISGNEFRLRQHGLEYALCSGKINNFIYRREMARVQVPAMACGMEQSDACGAPRSAWRRGRRYCIFIITPPKR